MGDWEQKKFRPGECEIPIKECKAFFSNVFYFSGCPNCENIEQVCQRTQKFLKELASREDLSDIFQVVGIPTLLVFDNEGHLLDSNGKGAVVGSGLAALQAWQAKNK